MTRDDLGDDRESQAATAASTFPAVLKPDEPLKDPIPVVQGDAGPVVSHLQSGGTAGRVQAKGHRGPGVANRVVDQVAHGPFQLAAVPARLYRSDVGGYLWTGLSGDP